jgi:DNA-binding NarL/FixJ family response regulator
MRENVQAAGGNLGHSVLVVDDFEPWRRRVCSELQKDNRWQVVAEVIGGRAAVREARERRPDVIVLDIGLDDVNGVEAARRIVADNPAARILFLTGQQSPDIAEAALETGARGYLLKTDAGGRLLLAMETILSGGRFLSPSLPEHVADVPRRAEDVHGHRAAFHTHEAGLVNDYVRFAEAALAGGDAVIAVATSVRLAQVRDRLIARGVAIHAATRDGRYREIDSMAMIRDLLSNDSLAFDAVRESGEALIESASAGGRRVSVFGEAAPAAWEAGHPQAAVTLERAWDAAVTAGGALLLCGYLIDGRRFASDGYATFRDVCGAHGDVHVH